MHAFSGGSDGGGATGPLVETGPGTFFGTTQGGGAYGKGTVFKLVID